MRKYVVRWQNRFMSGELVARDDIIIAANKKAAQAAVTACYGRWREFAIISVHAKKENRARGKDHAARPAHSS